MIHLACFSIVFPVNHNVESKHKTLYENQYLSKTDPSIRHLIEPSSTWDQVSIPEGGKEEDHGSCGESGNKEHDREKGSVPKGHIFDRFQENTRIEGGCKGENKTEDLQGQPRGWSFGECRWIEEGDH